MARKKKSKIKWFRILLLFLFVPATVWLSALLIWFYWQDLNSWLRPETARRAQPSAAPPRDRGANRNAGAEKPMRERIVEEDRRQLEDLLKRRN